MTAAETKTFTLGLGPLDSDQIPIIRNWRNDYRIWQFTRQNDYLDDLEHIDWFKRQASDPTIKMYRVQLSDGEKTSVVGVCGFTSIDYRNSRAEFSLYIAPGCQRNKLGSRALSLLIAHGFENHGFRLIYGETFADNPAAKMFEAAGFKREGTRRQFYFKGGRPIDAHIYSILREEWHGRLDICGDSGSTDSGGDDQLPNRPLPGLAAGGGGGAVATAGSPPNKEGQAQAKGVKRRRRMGEGTEGAPREGLV